MDLTNISFLELILITIPVSLLGAWGMNAFMIIISRQREVPVDMVAALGGLFTGNIESARRTGLVVHSMVGLLITLFYIALWIEIGVSSIFQCIALSIGFSFFHGLLTSYALMYFVSERHPIEQYRNAGLPIGVIHLLGHLVFGLSVGILGGITLMLLS